MAGTVTATLLAMRCRRLQLILRVFRMLSEITRLFTSPDFPLSDKTVHRVGTKSSVGRKNTAMTTVTYHWLKPALRTLKTASVEESLLPSRSCHVASLATSSRTSKGRYEGNGCSTCQGLLLDRRLLEGIRLNPEGADTSRARQLYWCIP